MRTVNLETRPAVEVRRDLAASAKIISGRRFRATVAVLVLSMGVRVASAKTLFDSMGGEPVLKTAVERFSDIIIADDRINFTFADADMSKFKQLLYDQLCELSGGPCHYKGRDMVTAHAKLKLTTAEFNALAEDLYFALGKAGVSYRQQNRLMALLAPMKRQIVNAGQTERAASATDEQPEERMPPATPSGH